MLKIVTDAPGRIRNVNKRNVPKSWPRKSGEKRFAPSSAAPSASGAAVATTSL